MNVKTARSTFIGCQWPCKHDFWLKILEKLAYENHHLLFYWPSFKNLISNISPESQVLTFPVSELFTFLKLTYLMSIKQKQCGKKERKYFHSYLCQRMPVPNATFCQYSVVDKNFGESCLAWVISIFDLSNLKWNSCTLAVFASWNRTFT